MHYEEKKRRISSNQNGLVSVVTPLYNSENFIEATIASVLNQTYPHWELFIIDDASTDSSFALAESFAASDSRIHLVKLDKNKGAAFCRNYATKLANGDFIAFLDADDLWLPQKLEKQLDLMNLHQCDVSYTSYLQIDETGNSMGKIIHALPELNYAKQHRNNYIGNLTGMYRVKSLGKLAAPVLRKRQDWAVWLSAIQRSKSPAFGLDEVLAKYRVRKGSISANKLDLVKYNYLFYREYLGYSVLRSSFNLILFFWEYFLIRPKYIEKL